MLILWFVRLKDTSMEHFTPYTLLNCIREWFENHGIRATADTDIFLLSGPFEVFSYIPSTRQLALKINSRLIGNKNDDELEDPMELLEWYDEDVVCIIDLPEWDTRRDYDPPKIVERYPVRGWRKNFSRTQSLLM
jgi:hypothetical protein